jgi:hypothetical protein
VVSVFRRWPRIGRGRHWLGKDTVNVTNVANPFSASVAQTGNPQFNRRERFKKVFFAVLAAHVILFLTLLIQGCRTGQDTSSAPSESALAQAQH